MSIDIVTVHLALPTPRELNAAESLLELAERHGHWSAELRGVILIHYHLGVAPSRWPAIFSKPTRLTTPCPVSRCSKEEHESSVAHIDGYFAHLSSGMDKSQLWRAIDSLARQDAIVAMTEWEREHLTQTFC